MTCRCSMCGVKNAGKTNRGSYIKAGVRCSEYISKSDKKLGRRQRRAYEKRQTKVLAAEV